MIKDTNSRRHMHKSYRSKQKEKISRSFKLSLLFTWGNIVSVVRLARGGLTSHCTCPGLKIVVEILRFKFYVPMSRRNKENTMCVLDFSRYSLQLTNLSLLKRCEKSILISWHSKWWMVHNAVGRFAVGIKGVNSYTFCYGHQIGNVYAFKLGRQNFPANVAVTYSEAFLKSKKIMPRLFKN